MFSLVRKQHPPGLKSCVCLTYLLNQRCANISLHRLAFWCVWYFDASAFYRCQQEGSVYLLRAKLAHALHLSQNLCDSYTDCRDWAFCTVWFWFRFNAGLDSLNIIFAVLLWSHVLTWKFKLNHRNTERSTDTSNTNYAFISSYPFFPASLCQLGQ